MGADHYINTAFGKPSERLRPLSTRIAPGEKRQSQPRGLAEFGERLMMLAGKNFGWYHQRRLTSRLDHRCHGKERDESLAGSNIALQKPQHAGWRRKVRVYFAERGFLRSRQSERQGGCNLFSDMAVPRAYPAAGAPDFRPHQSKRQLGGEQFVKSKPHPHRRFRSDCLRSGRAMDFLQGLRERWNSRDSWERIILPLG